MQTTAKLRAPTELLEGVQQAAKARKTSVSAKIREAMEPYLTGKKQLPVAVPNDRDTTFTCYVDDFSKFKDLAKAANLSWDEALRIVLTDVVRDAKRAHHV